MVYDVIIVGGGPGGLTAGIYAGRANLKTLMLEKLMPGGQAASTDWVENYPGFEEGIGGFDLMQKMEKQAKRFGLEIESAEIESADLSGNVKRLMAGGKEYQGRSVILSTGTTPKPLGVPGEKEFRGHGVSYCATCDGPFFKDKDIVVVGGGSSGVQESLYLTRFVKSIKLVEFTDHLCAERILQKRLKQNPKISIYLKHEVMAIEGDKTVNAVRVRNKATGATESLSVNGAFIWVGVSPNTEFLAGQVKLNPWGYVVTDAAMKTSVPGVFAAGDLRDMPVRQITTAVADGTVAAISALCYIEGLENHG